MCKNRIFIWIFTFWRFVPEKFEELFKKHARTNGNALTAGELDELLKANKQPKDFAGQ